MRYVYFCDGGGSEAEVRREHNIPTSDGLLIFVGVKADTMKLPCGCVFPTIMGVLNQCPHR